MNRYLAIAAGATLLATAACQNMGHREAAGTGIGAITGGLLGHIIGEGDAEGILIGAAVGGLIGNRIGAALDRREAEAMAQASLRAVEHAQTGEQVRWAASDEAGQVTASGWVVPTTDSYQMDDKTCRNVQQVAFKKGQRNAQDVTMCRSEEASSKWVIPGTV